jgi:hypothetical protein
MPHGFYDPEAALLELSHTRGHVYCFARRGIMLKACRFDEEARRRIGRSPSP